MIEITHDWDRENYVHSLNHAWDQYRKACYGVRELPQMQIRETKQAFLSGIHWLATRESYCPDDIESALRAILGEHNSFIKPTKTEPQE